MRAALQDHLPRRGARLAIGLAAAIYATALGLVPAAAEEISAPSRVVAVTVYPDAAAVTRRAPFTAPDGRHVILLEDAPDNLDPASLRIRGEAAEGVFTILSAERGVVSVEPTEAEDAARAALEQRIEDARWRLRAAEDARGLAGERLDYLRAFRRATLTPGSEVGGSALLESRPNWDGAWERLETEMAAAAEALRDAERAVQTAADAFEALQQELALYGPDAPNRKVLKIAIEADGPIRGGRLDIVYLIGEASWLPLYDLKLGGAPEGEANGPVANKRSLELTRRAAVRQWTGESWDGVRLTLSTARPSGRLAGVLPRELIARVQPPVPEIPAEPALAPSADGAIGGMRYATEEEAPTDQLYMEDAEELDRERKSRAAPARQAGAATRLEGERVVYELETEMDIAGDGSTAFARIGDEKLLARIEVRVSPALDETGYLTALVTIGETLPPGIASIYRDGAYLGQTRLSYVAPGDKTALPFGPVEGIRVNNRVLERLRGAEGVFTTSATNRERYRIELANLTETPWPLVVYAAAPVTEDEKIEISLVTPIKPSDTNVDGRRGVVAWRFDMEPGAEQTLDYGWDVAWPEGEQVIFSPR